MEDTDVRRIAEELATIVERLSTMQQDLRGEGPKCADSKEPSYMIGAAPVAADQMVAYQLLSPSTGPAAERRHLFYLGSDDIPPWHDCGRPYFVTFTISPEPGTARVVLLSENYTTKNGTAWASTEVVGSSLRVTMAVGCKPFFGPRNWVGLEVAWRCE